MQLPRNERVKYELQMLTGIVTEDISYMCYLLLKDGIYFKDERDKEVEINVQDRQKEENLNCISLDDFFKSL